MNNRKSIGIIGGAGPDAGVLLFRQIIRLCQKEYGCKRDYDFPLIHLLSYPFTEMLSENPDKNKIQSELKWAYNQLQSDYIVITCNTLHTFIDETFSKDKLLHLINKTQNILTQVPLVLCSSTSRKTAIHQKFFPCHYPDVEQQKEVEKIIDEILAGQLDLSITSRLEKILESVPPNTEVILGCTELSLIHDTHPLDAKWKVIDPSWNMAKELCKLIFNERV